MFNVIARKCKITYAVCFIFLWDKVGTYGMESFHYNVHSFSLCSCYTQGSCWVSLKNTPGPSEGHPGLSGCGCSISTVPVARVRRPRWTPAVNCWGGRTAKACCTECAGRAQALCRGPGAGGRNGG
jgi:hypothetical protein